MQSPSQSWFRLRTLRAVALPALVITLGMETIRVLFPSLAWYMRDTLGASSISVGAYVFGAALFGFTAAWLRRLTGPRLSLWLTGGGVAVLRLAEQISTLPAIDLWLSLVGFALFLMFIPIFVGQARSLRPQALPERLGFGMMLGLGLDSAIHGAAGTLDLSWIPGIGPILVALLLTIATLWLLALEPRGELDVDTEAGWSGSLPLIALGPFLLLEAIVFQNQGWISEVALLSSPAAYLIVMLGNTLGLLGVAWGLRRQKLGTTLAIATGLYLLLALLSATTPTPLFALTALVAQFVMGWGWGRMLTACAPAEGKGLGPTTVMTAAGMLLFVIMGFIYYVAIDIALPIPRTAILPGLAVILGLGLVYTALVKRPALEGEADPQTVFAVSVAMIAFPLVYWALLKPLPAPTQPTGLPIRVMTYNIHSSYSRQGRQDPEEIAQAIESADPDVVGLQEVSRGWLIDGSTDLPFWLSRRLGMQVLFSGTTGPMWGNAVLTRYPVLEHGSGRLPLAGTLLQRGYLWARIDAGAPRPILFIDTHLHHIESEHAPRLAQIPVILDFWNGEPSTIFVGDLNSRPDFPEIKLIADAGFVDSWAQAGQGDGYTFSSDAPYERIDWIWHTPDLVALDIQVPLTTASDHRPLWAVLDEAD
jgi:endonuclease/exonuclease/phosphatase family metal-dependent hydrolase